MPNSTPRIRLCFPCRHDARLLHGDWYFGLSLSQALVAQGADVVHAFRPSSSHLLRGWNAIRHASFGPTVDLVLRGKRPTPIDPRRPHYIWLISQAQKLTTDEVERAAHIFVASEPYAEELRRRGASASFLPQCTDERIFHPRPSEPELRSHLLFVGNRRGLARRVSVRLARRTGRDLAIWGRGWDDVVPAGVLRGESIPNHELGRHYASADVVLNDHHIWMRRLGFLSNRVFDVIASGRPVLTEEMPGIPQDMRPHLFTYTARTFDAALEAALAAPPDRLRAGAEHVLAYHTFHQRAKSILDAVRASHCRGRLDAPATRDIWNVDGARNS